ncbi:hypothetical protein ACTFIU_006125 [Dictyostelium citrinum]
MATLYDIFNEINNKNQENVSNNKKIEIIPDMDVTVTDDMFLLNVELAGVNKKDIQIEIKDSILCIQGEKYRSINNKNNSPQIDSNNKVKEKLDKSPKTTINETKKFISERSFGHFEKYLDLTPVFYQLDLNTVDAQFEDGLLTITVKKTDLSNNIKIEIN